MKPCGDVICKVCVEKFVKKSKKCFVCNIKCKEKDIADMSGEGDFFFLKNFLSEWNLLIPSIFFFLF